MKWTAQNAISTFLMAALSFLALLFLLPSSSTAAHQTNANSSQEFDRSLTLGSTGADVTVLQQLLESSGFFHTDPTGYFGMLTQQAVAAFQSASGLDAVRAGLANLNKAISGVSA